VAAARDADQVLLFISNAETDGGESHDVSSIGLEKTQHAMAKAVLAARPDSVLVMISGSIIGFDETLASAQAALAIWMPGVYGGLATAQTIFGDNNPGGKLPVTWYYANYTSQSDFKNMSMQHGPGRTYRYLVDDFPIAFPFGHGLSYTSFALRWPTQAPSTTVVGPEDSVTFSVEVANAGKIDGDEVVMVYAKPPRNIDTLSINAPIVRKQLVAFQRIGVFAGDSSEVKFTIPATALGLADETGAVKLHAGDYTILVSQGHGVDLELPVKVKLSSPALLKPFRKWWPSTETMVI